ncbi:tryptophan--tRNA ligase, mitochondrial [Anthonomus grandis grandis]|uniref:tryptophan--tRNA ligase, mitochondrial n=1 Tax=Anthonomus grandis grandis TaxID=2921223 RepID=UPI002166626B|nr:tryptophan--tRNA ligase, mitochondrial [Anthonomus grandis grandis]
MTILRRISRQIVKNSRKYSSEKSSPEPKYPTRVFSGIQPTGSIHLGNYLGAISQWVQLQNQNKDLILSIVDLHSITLPHEPKKLSRNILELTATLLACGIDPNKAILFQQSKVSAHAELCWCLGCISTMARLAHLPQYKEKSENLKNIPLGLFVYPVLQAADILSYKATHIPVGEDQVQQIQLCQELARIFNGRFGETFPIPRSLITSSEYGRVRSLRDPSKKMSKSDPDEKSRICMTDMPDTIARNIKKAVTDFTSEVTFDPVNRPGVSNLISIHSFVSGKSVNDICQEVQGIDTGKYKFVVADAVISYVKPIQEKIGHYLNDVGYLYGVLEEGNAKAAQIANVTLKEVHEKLGMTVEGRKRDDIVAKCV